MQSKLSRVRARISGRYALVTAAVVVVGMPAGALAAGEGRSIFAGQRNPGNGGELTRETEIIAQNSTYGTRQSNKGAGGGAIYGCRTDLTAEPCVRSNNLKAGRAFEFDTAGKEAGKITVKDPTGVPFTTNAKGTVTNLSADTVDGKDSTDFAGAGDLLFAAVNADGTLVAGARGATASTKSNAADQTYVVTFNRDVSKCSYTASLAGVSADFSLGVGPVSGQVNQVQVDQRDAAATPPNADGRGFHLQVVC